MYESKSKSKWYVEDKVYIRYPYEVLQGGKENGVFKPGTTTAGKGKEEGGKLTRSGMYLVIMLDSLRDRPASQFYLL